MAYPMDPLAASPMVHIALDDTLGAAFLGNIAAASLYGITVLQTYIYYGRNPNDRLYLKTLVFGLWVLDSLHLALVTHTVYLYAVTDFGNFLAIEVPTWSVLTQIAVTGVSDLIVRGGYGNVRCLFASLPPVNTSSESAVSNKNWFLIVLIGVTSLVVFGGSIAFVVKGFGIPNYPALIEISDILYVSLGAGVAADIFIAASMCVLLAQRQTGFASLCALLTLITYATMPDNFIFIGFYFVLPKLFLNSLLATLNARRTLREGSGTLVSIPLSATASSHPPPSSRPPYSRGPRDDQGGMQIQVHTATELKTDHAPPISVDELRRKSWGGVYVGPQEPLAITV
ncbi:hypothetical protein C8Q78DRAFT_1075936 [Trametes maxima]|nr:hypothetical protein C8Q78DRAFT_1075936 [Trametes maxima]